MATFEDFGVETAEMTGIEVVALLDGRIREILGDVRRSEVWNAVMGEGAQSLFMREVLREIYLEIYMYQRDHVEAAIEIIGQFPRSLPPVLFDAMLHHQAEEFDHGEMALRDYIAFGGNENYARTRSEAPSAYAVSAIWRNMAHNRDPFYYLGAIYLFEALTPIITGEVKEHLKARLGGAGLEFVVHHATADLEHSREMKELIVEILGRYPDKVNSVVYGFECFANVYPLAGWMAALRRAERRFEQQQIAAE